MSWERWFIPIIEEARLARVVFPILSENVDVAIGELPARVPSFLALLAFEP